MFLCFLRQSLLTFFTFLAFCSESMTRSVSLSVRQSVHRSVQYFFISPFSEFTRQNGVKFQQNLKHIRKFSSRSVSISFTVCFFWKCLWYDMDFEIFTLVWIVLDLSFGAFYNWLCSMWFSHYWIPKGDLLYIAVKF